jgi:hypothetical protein
VVALERHQVRQPQGALELPTDGADLDVQHASQLVLADALQPLAAGQRPRQHVRVQQRLPDQLARRVEGVLALDLHDSLRVWSAMQSEAVAGNSSP